MELTPKQQITELIKNSEKILVITHESPDGDAIGSILAMFSVLKKLKKDVTAVCSDPLPDAFKFLPLKENLHDKLSGTRDFILSIDLKGSKPDKLSYNIEESKLNIIVTPKGGNYAKDQVNFNYGAYKYDLIVVLDSPDLDRLGKLYEANTEMLFKQPIINIDHHASNEYFGQVNLVDLTATSTSEILMGLIESLGPEILDEDIATCLLAGIIADTNSFQNPNTTPKSLTVTAQLIAAGARQQEIVQNLYKKKSLSTLKLWGKILSGVKSDPDHHIVWSIISNEEIKDCDATPEETSGAIDELLATAPDTDINLLFAEEEPKNVKVSVRTSNSVDATKIAAMFGGGGHPQASGFEVKGKPLEDTEKYVLQKMIEYQESRIKEIAARKRQKTKEIIPQKETQREEIAPPQEKETIADAPQEETQERQKDIKKNKLYDSSKVFGE